MNSILPKVEIIVLKITYKNGGKEISTGIYKIINLENHKVYIGKKFYQN